MHRGFLVFAFSLGVSGSVQGVWGEAVAAEVWRQWPAEVRALEQRAQDARGLPAVSRESCWALCVRRVHAPHKQPLLHGGTDRDVLGKSASYPASLSTPCCNWVPTKHRDLSLTVLEAGSPRSGACVWRGLPAAASHGGRREDKRAQWTGGRWISQPPALRNLRNPLAARHCGGLFPAHDSGGCTQTTAPREAPSCHPL